MSDSPLSNPVPPGSGEPHTAKRVPIRRMKDEKLLFEINRRVLHPLGYALAIEVPDKGLGKREWTRFCLLETTDPEGYFMGELEPEDRTGLAIQEDRRKRFLATREAIGYPGGVEPLDV